MVANPESTRPIADAGPPLTSGVPEGPPTVGAEDAIIVLEGATWADFERILAIRGDNPAPRLAFIDGSLELMTPSRHHESIKSVIGCLIEAWCFEREVDIHPYGSWTLKEAPAERGLEPDECYVVGSFTEHDPDPERPDLAIEVVWTSGGVNKLDIYLSLGVAEVWYWRGGSITLFGLQESAYVPIAQSAVLPGIDHEQLATFVGRRPMTRAVRAYREALRGDAAAP